MSDAPVTEVQIRGGQGYLLGAPAEAMDALQKATSFRPAGFQFSPAFNAKVPSGKLDKDGKPELRRKWDGRIKLLKHSKFPAGLRDTICKTLRAEGVRYTVTMAPPEDLPVIPLGTVGIQSRDYQDEAVEAALLNPNGGVIRAPTGAGKTPMAARIIAGRQRRALVIVPTLDLLYQFKGFLEKHLIVPGGIGQLGDGIVDPREVTVTTIRTVAKAMDVAYETYEFAEYDDKDDTDVRPAKLREWLEGIGTLLVDECHILGAQVVFDVTTKSKAPYKAGMSASPWRDDGADLMIEGALGHIVYEIGTAKLVEDDWLVPPLIEVVDTTGMWQPAPWGKGDYQKAYAHEVVENPVRNQLIADRANAYDSPTLILVKQIRHGKMLQPMIEDSVFLSGKDSSERRNEVYADLRAGRLKRIIATTIADMGLDLPICQNLIQAGGGKSSTRHLQRIGRVVRPYEGKRFARVLDLDDGHAHKWFRQHAEARRKIEHAEWDGVAVWL